MTATSPAFLACAGRIRSPGPEAPIPEDLRADAQPELLDLRVSEPVALKARDTEVSAEVEQIYGTQVAGHSDQRKTLWSLGQHHRAAHVDAVHYEPHIGGSVAQWAAVVGRGHQVFPAAQVVGLAHRIDDRFIGHAISAEAEQMDTDAVEFVDGLPDFVVRILDQAGGRGEHGAVQREARF